MERSNETITVWGTMIAGLMAISDYPFSSKSVFELSKKCDVIILRFDVYSGNYDIFENCIRICDCDRFYIESIDKWNRWNWRQELIASLDDIKPEYVLFPDSDESYDISFDNEFEEFKNSKKDLMMFDYEMKTIDNRNVEKYPKARHCKVFRWEKEMTYYPYKGYAIPNYKNRQPSMFMAVSKINHFCFWTKEMERKKILHR